MRQSLHKKTKHLVNSFNFFDVDNSGYITLENLKTFLCPTDYLNCDIEFVMGEVVEDRKIDLMTFLSILNDKCEYDQKIV